MFASELNNMRISRCCIQMLHQISIIILKPKKIISYCLCYLQFLKTHFSIFISKEIISCNLCEKNEKQIANGLLIILSHLLLTKQQTTTSPSPSHHRRRSHYRMITHYQNQKFRSGGSQDHGSDLRVLRRVRAGSRDANP